MKHVLLIAGGAVLAYWYMQRSAPTGASASVPTVAAAQPISPPGTASGMSAPTSVGTSAPSFAAATNPGPDMTVGVAPTRMTALGIDTPGASAPQTASPTPFAIERTDYSGRINLA